MRKGENASYSINQLIGSLWGQKLVRFFVVGCINTVIDISLLLIFYRIVGLSEVLANTISVSIAISISYFLNHHFVFRYHQKYSLKNYLRFFAVTGFGVIFIQDLVIYFVTQRLWVIPSTKSVIILDHQFLSKTLELLGSKISAVFISMVWNFLLYKYIVFRHQATPDEADELIVA